MIDRSVPLGIPTAGRRAVRVRGRRCRARVRPVIPFAVWAVIAAVGWCGCGRFQSPGTGSGWNASTLQLPPGIPARELPDPESTGAALVERDCSGCHGIPSPASEAREDWGPTLRRMYMRMERMAGMRGMVGSGRMPAMGGRVSVPSPSEQDQILSYLRAHAMRSIEPQELRKTTQVGGRLFVLTCSRCHALPDPAQHTGAEWPQVVERMRSNMREMNLTGITDSQARDIDSYLERVATEPSHRP
jgi:cytochrome c5